MIITKTIYFANSRILFLSLMEVLNVNLFSHVILVKTDFFFFFLERLWFELRASCLKNSCSTAWATLSVSTFCSGYFRDEVSQHYLPRLVLNHNPSNLSLWRLAEIPISARVTGVTGAWLKDWFLILPYYKSYNY
jgi:hypothetical protein